MNTQRAPFDPSIIDHTNEDLIRYHFVRLADAQKMPRRTAEVLFRAQWDRIRRTITSDRNLTYLALTLIITEADNA